MKEQRTCAENESSIFKSRHAKWLKGLNFYLSRTQFLEGSEEEIRENVKMSKAASFSVLENRRINGSLINCDKELMFLTCITSDASHFFGVLIGCQASHDLPFYIRCSTCQKDFFGLCSWLPTEFLARA